MTSIAEETVRTGAAPDADPTIGDHVNGSDTNGVLPGGAAVDLSPATDAAGTPTAEPFVQVVKGSPTDEELAALVTVLAAAAAAPGAGAAGSSRPPETWGDPVQNHRLAAPFSPYSFPRLGTGRR